MSLGVVALALLGAAGAAWQPWRPAATVAQSVSPERPPIAVLDFGDPASPVEDRQIGRAYAEELTVELGRNADLTVISAQSSFAASGRGDALPQVAGRLGAAYVVSGSLRREGDRLRLLVQLVSGRDGRVVWTERQSIEAAQVHVVRDALVQRIAATLQVSMRSHIDTLAVRRPPATLDIYGMTLRAIALKHRFTPEASAEGRSLLEKVVGQDPLYAPGWLYLGWINSTDYALGFTAPRRPEMLRQAIAQLEHAAELDPRLSQAQAGLAFTYSLARRFDDAVRAGRRCVDLAPSDADCLTFLANALVRVGQPKEALPLMRRVWSSSPLPAPYVRFYYSTVLWANHLLDEALATLDDCIAALPRNTTCRIARAYGRTEAGRVDEARADLAEWHRLVGPGKRPEGYFRGLYSPAGHALEQRRQAALALMQAEPPSPSAALALDTPQRRP